MPSLDDDEDALAYRAGRQAYLSGQPIENNPHAVGTLVHSMWDEGFHDAENGMDDTSQIAEDK